MSEHNDCHSCASHAPVHPSVHQSLDELEFERGIWSAALEGNTNRINLLLERGTNVNSVDAAGYTALHYAARAGHEAACRILLKHGALVDCRTRAGQATPLHRAAASGRLSICKLLIEAGADIQAIDADGKDALTRATAGKYNDVVAYLLSVGTQS